MNYDILDESGDVINTIAAEAWFVEKYYSGRYRENIPTVIEPEPSSVLTVLQARRLFTFEEKMAIEQAIQGGNNALKVFMGDLAVSSYVNLTDPLVEQGLGILVQSEIITSERMQEILEYRITHEVEPDGASITVLQLRQRFTLEEKIAIESAIAGGNLALKVFMDDLAVSSYVDLTDPLVEQGLGALVASSIINEARKAQILANEELNAADTHSD